MLFCTGLRQMLDVMTPLLALLVQDLDRRSLHDLQILKHGRGLLIHTV